MNNPLFRTTIRTQKTTSQDLSAVQWSVANDAASALARLRSDRKLGCRQASSFAEHPAERVAIALVRRAELIPSYRHPEIAAQLWDRALTERRWNPLLDVLDQRAGELRWGLSADLRRAHELSWKVAEWLEEQDDPTRSARVLEFRSERIQCYFAEHVRTIDAGVLRRFRKRAPGFAWILERRFPTIAAGLGPE